MPLASQERVEGVSRFGRNRSRFCRNRSRFGRDSVAIGRNRSRFCRENETSFCVLSRFGRDSVAIGRNRSQSVAIRSQSVAIRSRFCRENETSFCVLSQSVASVHADTQDDEADAENKTQKSPIPQLGHRARSCC